MPWIQTPRYTCVRKRIFNVSSQSRCAAPARQPSGAGHCPVPFRTRIEPLSEKVERRCLSLSDEREGRVGLRASENFGFLGIFTTFRAPLLSLTREKSVAVSRAAKICTIVIPRRRPQAPRPACSQRSPPGDRQSSRQRVVGPVRYRCFARGHFRFRFQPKSLQRFRFRPQPKSLQLKLKLRPLGFSCTTMYSYSILESVKFFASAPVARGLQQGRATRTRLLDGFS